MFLDSSTPSPRYQYLQSHDIHTMLDSHSTSQQHEPRSLRSLLTSLLLLSPPTLSPTQLSSDLHMRQRMLGLSSTAPHAYDSETSYDTSLSDMIASQHAFACWLSRPPIELDIDTTNIASVASALFSLREKTMQVACCSDTDPIDECEYQVWCCDAWHMQRKARRLVVCPEAETRLCMMLVLGQDDEWKLDNLFVLSKSEQARVMAGLHPCMPSCTRVHQMQTRPDAEEGGAEYINDADDFWAGVSDDEQDHARVTSMASSSIARLGTEVPAGAVEDSRMSSTGQAPTTEHQAAIRDIIRGAYTLHRLSRADTSDADSIEHFIHLVRSTISTLHGAPS